MAAGGPRGARPGGRAELLRRAGTWRGGRAAGGERRGEEPPSGRAPSAPRDPPSSPDGRFATAETERPRRRRRVPPEAAPPPSALPSAPGPALPLPVGTRRCRLRSGAARRFPHALRHAGLPRSDRPAFLYLFICRSLFPAGPHFLSRQLLVFLPFFYPRFPNPPALAVSFNNVPLVGLVWFGFFATPELSRCPLPLLSSAAPSSTGGHWLL